VHKVARVISQSLLVVSVAAASLAVASCGPSDRSRLDRPQSGLATATLRSGTVEIVVELAVEPAVQEIGLMHRKELEDGRGMLFVYEEDRRLSFWMKNTLIPLSIAYLGSDGVIKEIHAMEPLSLAPIESERYVRYALEAPSGWFGRVGLKPGDRFDLSQVPGAR